MSLAFDFLDWRKATRDPSPTKDYTSLEGASELKARIEAHWRAQGHEVQVMLIEAPFTAAIRAARYDVRSDLVNGMPREASS